MAHLDAAKAQILVLLILTLGVAVVGTVVCGLRDYRRRRLHSSLSPALAAPATATKPELWDVWAARNILGAHWRHLQVCLGDTVALRD